MLRAACRTTAAPTTPAPPPLPLPPPLPSARKRPRTPRRPSPVPPAEHVVVIDDDDEDDNSKMVRKEQEQEEQEQARAGLCWVDAWRPRTGAELAVSIVKQREVRRVLCAALDTAQPPSPARPALVLLSGPPGCGKTALVRVLATELRCDVLEYTNAPNASARGIDAAPKALGPSRLDAFRAWLLGAGHSCTLPLSSSSVTTTTTTGQEQGQLGRPRRRRLLLLEDLPFVTSEQSDAFRACVAAHMGRPGACPLVAVIDEQDPFYAGGAGGAAAGVLQRLAETHPGGVAIAVHAVTDRRMAAVLQRLARAHGLALAPAALAAVVRDAHGDVRSALNALQFAHSSDGTRDDGLAHDGLCARDAALSVFHAVGRVLKAERVPETGELRVAPQAVLAALATMPPDVFVDCCHENSTDAFASLDQLCAVLDDLSLADTLTRGSSFGSSSSSSSRTMRASQQQHSATADEMRALLSITALMHHHVRDTATGGSGGGGARPKRGALWGTVVRRCQAARQTFAELVPALVPADGGTDALASTEEIEDSDSDGDGDDSRERHPGPAVLEQQRGHGKDEEEEEEEDHPDYVWLRSTATAVLEVYPFAVHLPHTAVHAQCSRVRAAVEPRPGPCLDF